MRRILTVTAIVLATWTALELHQEGLEGAFGGRLGAVLGGWTEPLRSERASTAFQRAYDESGERVDAILDEPAAAER